MTISYNLVDDDLLSATYPVEVVSTEELAFLRWTPEDTMLKLCRDTTVANNYGQKVGAIEYNRSLL